MRVARCVAIGALVLVAACSSNKGVLEAGGPRIPDDAGVVSDATLERIQLDGKRSYDIASGVESFTTRGHTITPLLSWEGKYVHVGLDDQRKIKWIAGIGTVVTGATPVVYYSGVVDRYDAKGRRIFFEDGTVLRTTARGRAPVRGREIVCRIDPRSGAVRTFTVA